MKKSLKKTSRLFIWVLLCSTINWADEISDTIEHALHAYQNGDISSAKEELSFALELLRQKKGEFMKQYLPEALEGWHANEPKAQMAASGVLSGGTTLYRSYSKKGGAKIQIEIVVDSPLISGIISIFANPMFISGGKLMRIKREKAMLNYNEKNAKGEVTLMVDKRFMVTIRGEGVTKEEILEYAQAIDFKALKEI